MKQTNSSDNRKLFFLFLVLLTLILGAGYLQNVDWSSVQVNWFKLPVVERVTRQEEVVQKVVEEESAVIEVVESASTSVVSVLEKQVTYDWLRGPTLEESSIGTGFAVDKDLIVTNRHVVSSSSAEYTVVDNEGNRYPVKEIYRDPLNDLALLQIEEGDFQGLELGDSDQIKVGQTVVAIGNALGRFSNTVTRGVVSGIGRGITASSGLGQYQRLEDVIQTDAALNPGNSGGPLLNLGKQVIGVNVAVGQGTENIGFAIPGNRVREMMESFKRGEKISRPFLGVSYGMIGEELAVERNLVQGAFVSEVVEDSAAEKAGIEVNDIITHINEVQLTKEKTLAEVILDYQPGDKVRLKVWRSGRELELSAVLGEAPID